MAPKLETKSIIGIVAALIVGLMLSPLIISFVSSAQPYSYTTYQTLNSSFTDNDAENSPAYWDNVVTVNRVAHWSQPSGYVFDNADNGTAEWYQSVAVSSLHDGVSSATIAAKFRLKDNDALTSFTGQVLLDNGTDNIVIWESTSTENSASYTSIENDILSYITTTGTYTIRLSDEVEVTNDNNIEVRWDDASLTVVTKTETFTSMMILAYLIPLFFIIGLVLAVVYWSTSRS